MPQIDLGGETRELKFSFTVIRTVERQAGGKSIGYLTSPDHSGYDTMCLLIWGAIRHEDKKITVDQVGEWLDKYLKDGGTFEALSLLVTEAMIEGHILIRQPEGNAQIQ